MRGHRNHLDGSSVVRTKNDEKKCQQKFGRRILEILICQRYFLKCEAGLRSKEHWNIDFWSPRTR